MHAAALRLGARILLNIGTRAWICSYRVTVNVRSRETLSVDIGWRLFVEPNTVQRLTLEFLAAREIALEPDCGEPAANVFDLDMVE